MSVRELCVDWPLFMAYRKREHDRQREQAERERNEKKRGRIG